MADKFGLAVHMDGARLMNAAVALAVQPSVILQHCHSVSVCLSKVSTHMFRVHFIILYNNVILAWLFLYRLCNHETQIVVLFHSLLLHMAVYSKD